MTLLETNGLSACYGDFQALFGIDFKVDEGETVAVLGANGAGKSTFLNVIAGNVPVAKEQLQFDGVPMGGARACEMVARGVTLVPEGRRLFSSLTVEENLMMGAYGGAKGYWTLDKVYALFPKLKERRKQPATQMSGGEQQMAAIGRGLMANPRLLMCDELSLGLAPIIIAEIYETLATVRDRGLTLIIVEQNVQQAMKFAQRAYCFLEGRVSLHGASSELTREQVAKAYFGV
jgi:branched-chain amino acid transport system ATP-binding protein